MKAYRILEEPAGVYVQRHRSFLGIKWWSFLTEATETAPWVINYKTVDAAKAAIDKLLAGEPKPIITYYPPAPTGAREPQSRGGEGQG